MRHYLWVLLILLIGCNEVAVVTGPNKNVDSITIEVDWTTDEPPSEALLNACKSSIEGICGDVPVAFVLGSHLDGHGTWTDFNCREFAALHKDNCDSFYMIFAGGVYDAAPDAGGYSWNKRDFVVFPDVYVGNGGALHIAVVHEFLHCLGLVDKFLKMQTPHKHEYGNHCSTPGCIMQPVAYGTQSCPYCREDLEAGEEK